MKISEGEIEIDIPNAGKACKTWYRAYGDFKSNVRPLVCLHGGPGAGSNYLQSISDLAERYSIPVIIYDQIGVGKSTHLREKNGDEGFWTVDLFLHELDNVLKHFNIQDDYDLYGNSWGGMLGAEHAIRQPKGLRHLIIADSPADMVSWVEAANQLREKLPSDVQEVLKKHEADGTTDDPEYEEAVLVFYARHMCRIQPFPKEVSETLQNIKDDSTVYMTM